jgi:hypothetical protein
MSAFIILFFVAQHVLLPATLQHKKHSKVEVDTLDLPSERVSTSTYTEGPDGRPPHELPHKVIREPQRVTDYRWFCEDGIAATRSY